MQLTPVTVVFLALLPAIVRSAVPTPYVKPDIIEEEEDEEEDYSEPNGYSGAVKTIPTTRIVLPVASEHFIPSSKCFDKHPDCDEWAGEGHCDDFADYMMTNCPVACGVCEPSDSVRRPTQPVVKDAVGKDLGESQYLPDDREMRNNIIQRIEQAREYVRYTVMTEDRYDTVRELCRNNFENCAIWAVKGECEANPSFMLKQCAPVCRSCEELHVEAKCPLDPDAVNAWYPGDVHAMFERILDDPELNAKYNITVLASPDDTPEDNDDNPIPYVLMIDSFITSEEADRLIELGANAGYKRSTDVGETLADGTSEKMVSGGRTSMNSWCDTEECENDPVPNAIYERMEKLVDIPSSHSEPLQMLRYMPGQFYETHHDYIQLETRRVQGPRILTIFLYLSDVEEGGGTNFPELDITVEPKKGRAVMWPSVLNDKPNEIDRWTMHQALPVIKGIKYGANAWFHLRPLVDGCD